MDKLSYIVADVQVLATIILYFRDAPIIYATQHVNTNSLKQCITKFGDTAKQAAIKEMRQLHDRECFVPIDLQTISATEVNHVMESLILLTENKDGLIKGRHCSNGNPKHYDRVNNDNFNNWT